MVYFSLSPSSSYSSLEMPPSCQPPFFSLHYFQGRPLVQSPSCSSCSPSPFDPPLELSKCFEPFVEKSDPHAGRSLWLCPSLVNDSMKNQEFMTPLHPPRILCNHTDTPFHKDPMYIVKFGPFPPPSCIFPKGRSSPPHLFFFGSQFSWWKSPLPFFLSPFASSIIDGTFRRMFPFPPVSLVFPV